MAVALVLGLALAYSTLAPLVSGAPKSSAPVDTRSGARRAHRGFALGLGVYPSPPHPDGLVSPCSFRADAMAPRRALARQEEEVAYQAGVSRRWPRVARCELPRRP